MEEQHQQQFDPSANVALSRHQQAVKNARGKGTLALAAVLIHRFYMRRSLRDFKPDVRIEQLYIPSVFLG